MEKLEGTLLGRQSTGVSMCRTIPGHLSRSKAIGKVKSFKNRLLSKVLSSCTIPSALVLEGYAANKKTLLNTYCVGVCMSVSYAV